MDNKNSKKLTASPIQQNSSNTVFNTPANKALQKQQSSLEKVFNNSTNEVLKKEHSSWHEPLKVQQIKRCKDNRALGKSLQ